MHQARLQARLCACCRTQASQGQMLSDLWYSQANSQPLLRAGSAFTRQTVPSISKMMLNYRTTGPLCLAFTLNVMPHVLFPGLVCE